MSDSSQRLVPYLGPSRKQADQKYCLACGIILHVSASSCTACGAVQSGSSSMLSSQGTTGHYPPSHVFCRGCGQSLHESAPSCPHCGALQRGSAALELGAEKSRIGAACLALILGGFGAHKFYLGEVGLGLLYLFFSWTFIPAFIGLIEGIVYLAMSDARFARRYG
jgi:hypothetical protein